MQEEALKAIQWSSVIHRYWIARGYTKIKVSVDIDPLTGMYVIRSNLGPTGFPPR